MSSSEAADKPLIAERYRVVRELGQGGMGVVYEVIDEKTNRRRALKRIRAHAALDGELVKRFEQEVTVAGRIESDHVVEVFDAGVDDATQTPYLVMELLDGEDLGQRIDAAGRLPTQEVAAIFEQLARALAKTHAESVVHRDLKPENVFLTERDDGELLIKLLDFGVAKVLAADTLSPATTRVVGTPLYMAPEQFSGDGTIDGRADVYALGQMAFTMLVGTPFFEKERTKRMALPALAVAVASPEREPASVRAEERGVALPEGFDEWFKHATAADPDDRFEDALEAWASLRDVLAGSSTRSISVRPRAAKAERTETPTEIAKADTIASTPPEHDAFAETALASERAVKPTAESRSGRWLGVGAIGLVLTGLLFVALDDATPPSHTPSPDALAAEGADEDPGTDSLSEPDLHPSDTEAADSANDPKLAAPAASVTPAASNPPVAPKPPPVMKSPAKPEPSAAASETPDPPPAYDPLKEL